MSKTVLVVAAHPDDEVLGCGGTIAKHVRQGDLVHVIFLADGVKSRVGYSDKEVQLRLEASIRACKYLGIFSQEYLGFPDNKLDTIPMLDIVKSIEFFIDKIKPDIIYTHHIGDLNIDHKIVHTAVMTACRPLPNSSVKEIFCFEVLSSTEWSTPNINSFIPNLFVDISDFLDVKIEALKFYNLEMKEPPHSRSIEHINVIAKHHGFNVGCHAAEAFITARAIR